MNALSVVAWLGAVKLAGWCASLSAFVSRFRLPHSVRAQARSREGVAVRLAVLIEAEKTARRNGLSDQALGAVLVQLGRDVAAGRLRR
jgi:hypothetical protein